jgi:two-component system sensor histidine kinase DegS
MDATGTGTESQDARREGAPPLEGLPRLEGLLEEAKSAVSYGANSLRSVRERYREAHAEEVGRWERLRDELAEVDRAAPRGTGSGIGIGTGTGSSKAASTAAGTTAGTATTAPATAPDDMTTLAAIAAEEGAEDARVRTLRRDEAVVGREVGAERAALARIELALRSLENAWLFLGRHDDTLVQDPEAPPSPIDAQMRVVEAQEAERARLAREVHDGPAQALSNAIFQVEVVERMLDRDEALARAELRHLRETLRRELGEVRAYISQLRPPLLADLGLDGAIADAADQLSSVLGIPVLVEVDRGTDQLDDGIQTVILRVVQEALQNIRKHAHPDRVAVRVVRQDDDWAVEIRDDGRGFDTETVAARGRRNFGLQFMRERAELIGARFEVRSRPDGGTVVRIVIPGGAEEAR